MMEILAQLAGSRPSRWRASESLLGIAGCAAIALAVPIVTSSPYHLSVMTMAMIYALWAGSWDFMSGLTGRENFGFGLFVGIGAYAAAFMNSTFGFAVAWSFPVGIAAALLAALLLGTMTLNLKGPYFALAMLVSAAIMERFANLMWQYTGGQEGIIDISALTTGPMTTYIIVAGVVVVSLCILSFLASSDFGLALKALRGDETGCSAVGLNVKWLKISAFLFSAGFGSLGGVLFAHTHQHVNAYVLSIDLSLTIIILAYVGGLGSIYGPAISAILFTVALEMLRDVGQFRTSVYAVAVILIVFLKPDGLVAPALQKWRGANGE